MRFQLWPQGFVYGLMGMAAARKTLYKERIAMKPIELHLYLPFSYWLSRDPETGTPLQRPDDARVAEYLQALCMELGSMKEDFEDCEVTAIRFPGGYLSLLDAEDLSRVLIAVHRCFSVRKDCPVCGVMFPGRLDMEMISAYRRHRVSPLLFAVPSLSFRECERLGFPVTMQALDKTVYFLQNFNEDEWGLRLPIGIPGRTESSWRFLLGQLYHYRPKYLRFFCVDPTVTEDPAFAASCGELLTHGYRKAGEYTFSLSETVPLLLLDPAPQGEYVGAGLGARSRIDGFLTRGCPDWNTYKSKCRS